MPSGIYKRTPAMRKAINACLAIGRAKSARKKAANTIRRISKTREWREKVSAATKKAMRIPSVKKKHLAAVKAYVKKHGANFRGGNGQSPVDAIRILSRYLLPCGFILEFPIKTKNHGTAFKPPSSYKADFAHKKMKIIFEIDGPSHRSKNQKEKDHKKETVLKALGWKIFRITHD